jgi:hypothetical protein
MSQIDKVIYIPILFWFIILFIIFYGFIYSLFLSSFFYVFKIRNQFFLSLEILSQQYIFMNNLLNNFDFKKLLSNKMIISYILDLLKSNWDLIIFKQIKQKKAI